MSGEVLFWVLAGAALLNVLVLLGWAWAIRLSHPKLRRQAEERRRLNEEWLAIRTAGERHVECPRCAAPLSEQDALPLPYGFDVGESAGTNAIALQHSATRPDGPEPTGAAPPDLSYGSLHKDQQSWRFDSVPVQWSISREQAWNHHSPAQATLPVTIYLSDESVHEQVEAAVEDLLAASGVHVEHRDDPVYGSWFRRMRARAGQVVQSPLAREAAIVAAHAAESRLVHAQDATITATMLQNLGPVLTALHPTRDAVIRAGALLIVKVDWIVAIHQLTPAQQLQLDHQPQLAQSPHDILSALEHRTVHSISTAEAVDGVCGSTAAPVSLNGDPAPPSIVANDADAPPRHAT